MSNLSLEKINEWCLEYERIRPEYVLLTSRLKFLLSDMLRIKGIEFHLIEDRTKESISFREKISRESKSYTDPLKEITDLSGIRIITYYQDDAESVGNLIKSQFEIDIANSVEHIPEGAEFGYRSSHYVVSLAKKRADFLEWKGLVNLRAEIQVRTVLQHSWAVISHKLQYKREYDIPMQLRRKLFRLSALFELGDDEFSSLRDASGVLSKQIDNQLASGEKHIRIDQVSLSQFLEQSNIVKKLCGFAKGVGFNFDDPFRSERTDKASNSDLVHLLFLAKVDTISQLESLLKNSLPWAKDYLEDQVTFRSGTWYVSPAFICALLIIKCDILSKSLHLRPAYLVQIGWHREIAWRVFKIATKGSH